MATKSSTTGNSGFLLTGIFVITLAVAGKFLPDWFLFLATASLANGLVVLGLMLLMRSGLVSFGQALYSGLGAYAVGMSGHFFGISDAFLLLFLGLLVAWAVSFVLGFLLSGYRDIFFAMLSMAFSMILYGVLVKNRTLGSTDGFNVITPTFLGYAPEGGNLRYALFLLAGGTVSICCLLIHRYLKSAFGYLGEGIRENELRVEYLGMSVRKLIHIKYVAAATMAGGGGALTAMIAGHIDPDFAYWTQSGEFVFVTLLSGTGHVLAPFIGSFLFEMLRSFAFEYASYTWQLIMGSVMLLAILFLPGGIWSLMENRFGFRKNKESDR